MLEREVTTEEIRDILFHMPMNKAPGPNGYSVKFFKESWFVVGEGVVAAIKGFFASGLVLKEVNATILTSVSKKVNPSLWEILDPLLATMWCINALPRSSQIECFLF